MTRYIENKMVIEATNEAVKSKPTATHTEMLTFQLNIIATMLIDISKSLAIIADKAESEDKDADKKCTYKETGCGSCKWQLDCPIEADKTESEDKE